MYPVKIIPEGDKVAAERYRKFGRQQMDILRNQMSFQKLTKGSRQVSPLRGVLISCESNYNTHVVSIYVDPARHLKEQAEEIALKLRKRKLIIEPEVLGKKISYYVRIKYPDPEIDITQDPDGWWGVVADSLNMDRIVVWKMRFNNTEADIKDPFDRINRYNGFVPGDGEIQYDVDIINDIVYFPVDIDEEQTILIINKFKNIALRLPTNAEPIIDNALPDPAADWFGTGRIENPQKSTIMAGDTSVLSAGITLKLSDSYTVPIDTYYFFNDPVPDSTEPEWDASSYAEWRARWATSAGGDPGLYYDTYNWVGLLAVEDYYGTFALNSTLRYFEHDYTLWYYTYITTGEIDYNSGGGVIYSLSNGDGINETTVGGHFFTPDGIEGINSFFIVQSGPSEIFAGATTSTLRHLYGSETEVLADRILDVNSAGGKAHSKIVTPLESIQCDEYRESYSTDAGTCFEMTGTIWDSYDSVSTVNHFPATESRAGGQLLRDVALAHLGSTNIGLQNTAYNKNSIGRRDTHSIGSVHACNRKSDINIPETSTKFFSLFYFDEIKGAAYSSVCYNAGPFYYRDGIFSSSNCVCNGVGFDNHIDAVEGKIAKVGCVIYIFAPERFYKESVSGITTYDYWDIHSARRSEDIINPYRCLVLEEYILAIFKEKQQELDISIDSYQLGNVLNIAATMNYLGFGITNGFFETNIVLKDGSVIWEEI